MSLYIMQAAGLIENHGVLGIFEGKKKMCSCTGRAFFSIFLFLFVALKYTSFTNGFSKKKKELKEEKED